MTTEQRKCLGSAKFGIEPHEAPIEDFPKQASQKDGLGRMCRTHWNAYTTALRKAALERKAAEGEAVTATAEDQPTPGSETPATDEPPVADVTATAAADGPKRAKGVRGRRPGQKAGEVGQEGAAD